MIRRPPRSTLFPYPPLFRSRRPPPSRALPGFRHEHGEANKGRPVDADRKSTRLNSKHNYISFFLFFFFNDTPTTEIYTLPLPAALPISPPSTVPGPSRLPARTRGSNQGASGGCRSEEHTSELQTQLHLLFSLFFF